MAPLDFAQQRQRLTEDIQRRGIRDGAVLEAMRSVPREAFLPPTLRKHAYLDEPLPIGNQQTISQPFIVAYMTQALELHPSDRVLEVGTGSGYAAAVASRIARDVFTVERFAKLARGAEACLRRNGFENVHVLVGDGTQGWPEHAPYDAIIVAAGGPIVPLPLKEQLRTGGRLVIPVGGHRTTQSLVRLRKIGKDEFEEEHLCDVCFVPLVGGAGWDEPDSRTSG